MKQRIAMAFCAALASAGTMGQIANPGTMDADDADTPFGPRYYSPYAGRNFPTQVFWGDTHLHTNLSMDAGAFGNRLGMDDAYRFSKGEEVIASSGQNARLARPLDWVVIADHSDGMGVFSGLLEQDPQLMKYEDGRRWSEMIRDGRGIDAALELIGKFSQGTLQWSSADPAMMKPVWQGVVEAAERHNDPGKFTALIGYEWTSLIRGNNLHRVVIYRDDADKAVQTLPYTNDQSSDPEDLWKELQAYEDKTGGDVLAIPHNGNLSNGMMFATKRVNGRSFDKAYVKSRHNWEPLYEATQIKGDGEAHPFLSPDDEFADYETWDFANLDASELKTDDMLQYEYARSGLKLGLNYQAKYGVNPFQFGMIGSTDSHTSLAAVEEENFFGKHAGSEPSAKRMMKAFMSNENTTIYTWQEVSSGYAAVWARENTREALFDALARREVYGTTGPRMMVRFFGGWEFTAADARTRNPAWVGYSKGVPMGGELNGARSAAPSFLVGALRDPIGANLDRIQIVKGWRDGKGRLQEKVYDVVWGDADRRPPGGDGKIPAVGSTVDVADASWTNTIGDPELITVWQDPDFDPKQEAFYYARVLEIPTPRWTAYDAKRFGLTPAKEVPMTTQERAYTSPIWYIPE
ncbi:MAG: DUF3604 domain-containing protein [Halieaceae bacterium]